MEVLEAIRTRRMIGAFAPESPPQEVIERLIQAAVWAPNHHLTEPWRFHVLVGSGREALADAVEEWLCGPERPVENPDGEARSMRAKLLRSPAIVIVTQARDPQADDVRDLEDYAACACATHNLLLAAHAEGLAAKWSTGKLARFPPIRRFLGISPGDRVVAFVYLGYTAPDVPRRQGSRSPPSVHWYGVPPYKVL
jgi:nitroreductase